MKDNIKAIFYAVAYIHPMWTGSKSIHKWHLRSSLLLWLSFFLRIKSQ